MEVYLYMLFLALYFYYTNKIIYNKTIEQILLFIMFCMLFIVSAIRKSVGTDYNTYFYMYNSIEDRIYDSKGIEIGYLYLNKITKYIFGGEHTIFIITSLIIVGIVYLVVKRYSVDPLLSTILFMCIGMYLTSFNIIRQSIAMVFILYSYKYSETKIKWIVPIIIGSLFHKTALFVIPFYIICRMNLNMKHYITIVCTGILGYLTYDRTVIYITNFMDKFQNYQNSVFINEGANPIRTVISISILLFCIIGYEEIMNNKKARFSFNMTIFATIFSIFMIKGKIFARIVGYFDIFQILLIPYVIKYMNRYKFKKYSNLIITIIIMCSSLYFYHSIKTNQANVIPYKTYINK